SSPKQLHVLNPQRKHRPKDTTSGAMVARPSKTLADEEMAIDDSAAMAPASSARHPPTSPVHPNPPFRWPRPQ
ncbi:hypothetical protein OG21DRAFT_1518248, partial [Imleria badia]